MATYKTLNELPSLNIETEEQARNLHVLAEAKDGSRHHKLDMSQVMGIVDAKISVQTNAVKQSLRQETDILVSGLNPTNLANLQSALNLSETVSTLDHKVSMLVEKTSKRYGLKIRTSDGTCERTGDAVGMTFRRWNGSRPSQKSDFYNVGPWKGIKRALADHLGNVVAIEGDANYSLLKADTNGEYSQGTCFFKFYGRDEIVVENSIEYRWIEVSDTKLEGLETLPAFVREDGTERDYIFICATFTGIDSSGKIASRGGIAPLCDTSYNSFVNLYASQANSGQVSKWTIAHFSFNDVWRYLLYVEIGGLNAQSLVGLGISGSMPFQYSNTDGLILTEATTNGHVLTVARNSISDRFIEGMLVHVGSAYNRHEYAHNRRLVSIDRSDASKCILTLDGTPFTAAVGAVVTGRAQDVPQAQLDEIGIDCGWYNQFGAQERSHAFAYGLADPWGNALWFEGNKVRNNGKLYLNWNSKAKTPGNLSIADGWEQTDIGQYINNGYLKEIYCYKSNGRFTWMAKASGAGSNSYYCDYVYYYSADYPGIRVNAVGGGWSDGSSCGPSCVLGSYGASGTNYYLSSRAASSD